MRHSRSTPLPRRAVLGGVAAVGLTAALSSPGAATAFAASRGPAFRIDLPAPTGPHEVGTAHLHLVDPARTERWADELNRPRELMASIWYPARRAADGPPARYVSPGVASVLGRYAVDQFGLPPGAWDWGTVGTHATRDVPVAPSPHRRPVLLYTHGLHAYRDCDTAVVAELASRGFIVVTVDHTYDAMAVEFPDGRVRTTSPAFAGLPTAERTRAALADRVPDLSFVLDELARLARGDNPDAAGRPLPTGLARAVDLGRIGGFGHSLGPSGLINAMLRDHRIRAGVVLDGPLTQGENNPVDGARLGVRQPFMLMCGRFGRDYANPFHHRSPYATGLAALWENSPGWKRDLWSPDAAHYSYTDQQHLLPALDAEFGVADEAMVHVGTVDPGRFIATRRAYLTAFFTHHLLHRPQPLLDHPSPRYPDVRFID